MPGSGHSPTCARFALCRMRELIGARGFQYAMHLPKPCDEVSARFPHRSSLMQTIFKQKSRSHNESFFLLPCGHWLHGSYRRPCALARCYRLPFTLDVHRSHPLPWYPSSCGRDCRVNPNSNRQRVVSACLPSMGDRFFIDQAQTAQAQHQALRHRDEHRGTD